jgi:ABC-type cobalamin/Fe3+-siderophores transport system ATPase subunit
VSTWAPATRSANPFATERIRSGAIPYQFPDGEDAARLIERLRSAGWWGQIVGPHGSGKSTLLAALLPELARSAGEVHLARLHQADRRLPPAMHDALGRTSAAAPRRLLLIDGYEQLSPWDRWRLQHRCRDVGYGLLVSTHRRLWGLPVLCRCRATADTAWRVVRYLLREQGCPFAPADLATRLAALNGDLRELLFELYDWYEASRR